MLQQSYQFRLDGEPRACVRYGFGHINETYLLTDSTDRQYILQKINRYVFRDPEAVMNNVVAVTAHLSRTAASSREVLTLVPTIEGNLWLRDGDGEYWRVYGYVDDTICLDRAETPADFRESALAFGRFQRQLADFDAATLTATIPRFHDTPHRYAVLREALRVDKAGRAATVSREIDFALSRESYAATLTDLLAAGELPLRVTHNDTKLNNVLLDRTTRKAVCVIDLDTVMPGLACHDYGDSIRYGASTAAEDEGDLSKVTLSLELFAAYTAGFLSACRESLTPLELETLPDGAKTMTLECGVRFLTDYLSGDTYFSTSRPGQNLDRCRTQFRLVEEMERHWSRMQTSLFQEVRG